MSEIAEANEPIQEQAVQEPANGAGDDQANEPTTFTQEQVNSMVGKARTSEREKHEDAIKALTAQNEEAAKELETLRAEYGAMKAEKERSDRIRQVASESGVPSSLLRGDTLEELQEHAEAIRKALLAAQSASAPKYPVVNDSGQPKNAKMGKDEIMSIKDKKARKAAILANLDLF